MVITTPAVSGDFRWESTAAGGTQRGGIAYETLASMGASTSNVLRIHARLTLWFVTSGDFLDSLKLKHGVALFADRTKDLRSWMLDLSYLLAVVSLPAGTFGHVGTGV